MILGRMTAVITSANMVMQVMPLPRVRSALACSPEPMDLEMSEVPAHADHHADAHEYHLDRENNGKSGDGRHADGIAEFIDGMADEDGIYHVVKSLHEHSKERGRRQLYQQRPDAVGIEDVAHPACVRHVRGFLHMV